MEVLEPQAGASARSPVCSEAVLEQIRQAVSDGYLAFGHGGLEVGGVLFGKAGPEGLIIEAAQALKSDHAFGPTLRLSDADEEALSLMLGRGDSELAGLEAVGWYRSYTRSDAVVTAGDLAVLDRFFPDRGNVLLLLQPATRYTVNGFFYVRGESGTLNLEPVGEALALRPKFGFLSAPVLTREPPAQVVAAGPVSSQIQDQVLPIRREATSKLRLLFYLSLVCLAVACIVVTAIFAMANKQIVGLQAVYERSTNTLIASEQQRNADLKKQVADLTERNRRLEETLSILRAKPPLVEAPRATIMRHPIRKAVKPRSFIVAPLTRPHLRYSR